jgi:hypothetical protein
MESVRAFRVFRGLQFRVPANSANLPLIDSRPLAVKERLSFPFQFLAAP